MAEDKKNNNDTDQELKKLDEEIKDLHLEDSIELETDIQDIFEELNNNKDFAKEIEQILADLNEETIDLTKIQTQITLLIKKYLTSTISGEISASKKRHIIEIDQQALEKDFAEINHYLTEQQARLTKLADKNLQKSKYYGITEQSKKNFGRIIKNFAVYEIYKCMNPKRIAGETRKQNFAHNVIMGGIEHAKHYAGGSKSEISKYSPEFLKKLEHKQKAFKRNSTLER